MKAIFSTFVALVSTLTIVNSLPLLDPKESAVQPFSLSPGNVNPDDYFANVYANNGANPFVVSPPPGSPFGEVVQRHHTDDDHDHEDDNSHEELKVMRVKRSPQHHHGHGHGHGGFGHGGYGHHGQYGGHGGQGWGHGGYGHHGHHGHHF